MLQHESILEVVDNSGVQKILLFGFLGGTKKKAKLGDLVKAAVKKVKPNSEIKKGDVVLALIVCTLKSYLRDNNTWISFGKNCAVIVKRDEKKKCKLVGTRILIPLPLELEKYDSYKDIISLSEGLI